MYKLIGPDQKEYLSEKKGALGGHKRLKIYGRLDCPSALRYIAKGQYVQHRVFFEGEETALAAGYRPCGVCMKEHYKLWKEDKLMTHALRIEFVPEHETDLCTVHLANGGQKTLKHTDFLEDPSISEYAAEGFELANLKIEGDFCVINLLAERGQWGRTIVWDYVQDRIIHLASTPFARRSAIFNDQVVSLYLVEFWGHPASMEYSSAPLALVDKNYEPALSPLPLAAPDSLDDKLFDIRVEDGALVFRAGEAEYRLGSL